MIFKSTKKNRVAIIGAGASGIMSSISASRNNFVTTLYDKNTILGKKILMTGNGRCNISNTNVSWRNYFGNNSKFCIPVFNQLSNNDTIIFFNDLGLSLKEEDQGRLFPKTDQAQSVNDILLFELERLKVILKFNQKIKRITKSKNRFSISTYQNKNYNYDKIIIATGGKTYPSTGSTGDGFRFAQDFGHKIIKPFPVSTPMRVKSIVCNKLQGIKVNVRFKTFHNTQLLTDKTGELLFTHLGLSAPVVLESSREVSKIFASNPNANITCSINFFPDYERNKLKKLLKKRIQKQPNRNIGNQFIGLLPKKVAPNIFKKVAINPDLNSSEVSNRLLDKIVNVLTDYREKIDGVLGWDIAQFTAGGVDTKEIDPNTMESKIVKGLYFCGEIVDIDGQSGGYNLQWAWSSGYVAGMLHSSTK